MSKINFTHIRKCEKYYFNYLHTIFNYSYFLYLFHYDQELTVKKVKKVQVMGLWAVGCVG